MAMLRIRSWRILGPLCVACGAAFWGTETLFRVRLNSYFDSDVLVLIEQGLCLFFTLPAFLAQGARSHFSKKAWIYVILSGVLGSALGTYFFTEALRYLNTSVANVLLNFQPLISVFFAATLLGEKIPRHFYVWGLGALGCGVLIVGKDFSFQDLMLNRGLILVALTALSWGLSTVVARGMMIEVPLSSATFYRFLAGFITLLVIVTFKNKWNTVSSTRILDHADQFFLLTVISGIFPTYLYFLGVSKTTASATAFCEMAQTLAAVFVTWIFLGDALTRFQILGAAGLVYCIFRINREKHVEAAQ